MIPVDYWAIAAAAAVSIVLGFLWYGPLFGKPWRKEMGFTEEDMKAAMKKGMTSSYVLMILSSLVMSYVLAHALVFASSYLLTSGAASGAMAGFWNWLGFVAPVTLGVVLWEGKSWKLWFLNAGYYLVSLVLMGVVLAVWM